MEMSKSIIIKCLNCNSIISRANLNPELLHKMEDKVFYIKIYCLNRILLSDKNHSNIKVIRFSYVYNKISCAKCKARIGQYIISASKANQHLIGSALINLTEIKIESEDMVKKDIENMDKKYEEKKRFYESKNEGYLTKHYDESVIIFDLILLD